MEREKALVQLKDIFDVISDRLAVVEEVCNDQLHYPIKIEVVAHEKKLKVNGEKWTAPISLTIVCNMEEEN